MTQFVHDFETGSMEQKDLLGGKGANLAEMTRLGIPVPPGFTITTDACRHHLVTGEVPDGLWDEVEEHVARSRRGWAGPSATPRTPCSSRCAPARSSRCPG